ncbi:MAG: Hpt domain-containing protein, partial [Candidatus Accumulibacter sp.]|nr:Hpt domain-containing protein [Accumulibacter sp.]
MDIESITDVDALEEFTESLHDTTPVIERNMSYLKQVPGDRGIIATLFRSLHNVKGDAGLCKIQLAVDIVHPIETVFARLRNGEIQFSDILAEAILLAIDRLELAMENLCVHRPLNSLRLSALISGLERLAAAPASDVGTVAGDMIEAVTDFRPVAEAAANFEFSPAESSIERSSERIGGTLMFFRSLAEQFETRSPPFKDRTRRLLRLALETNRIREQVVDPTQLEAAVYMHDIGMMFLPESVWLKAGQMTPGERTMLHEHPGYAAGLLSRMEGWEAAAEMVAQHHEMPDGR